MVGEVGGVAGGVEGEVAGVWGGGVKAVLGEQALDLAGDGGGGVDEGDGRADEVSDERGSKGEVGAAEDELIDTGGEQGGEFGGELGADGGLGEGIGFNGGDKAVGRDFEDGDAAGMAGFDVFVELAVERAPGGEHADHAGLGGGGSGFYGGFHADKGHVWPALAEGVEGSARGSVTGHDNQFAATVEQIAGDALGKGDQFAGGAAAVGQVGLIGDVDEVFCGEGGVDGAEHAEAADAAVKNADGGRGGHGASGGGGVGLAVGLGGTGGDEASKQALGFGAGGQPFGVPLHGKAEGMGGVG